MNLKQITVAAMPTIILMMAIAMPLSQATAASQNSSKSAQVETNSINTAQLGGSSRRNNVSHAKNIPTQWEVGSFDRKTGAWKSESAKNIKWVARLGTQTYGTPIVCGASVFCSTNNGAGYLHRFPAKVDLGCLLCFSKKDGSFCWQYSCRKLAAGRSVDWPLQGICSSPLVENDRLWVVDSRGCVICLDVNGFTDGENDGSFSGEESSDKNEADIVWSFDMMKELGVLQHNMSSCSVTLAGDLLFVNTSNGVDDSHENVPAPKSPSFIALDKKHRQAGLGGRFAGCKHFARPMVVGCRGYNRRPAASDFRRWRRVDLQFRGRTFN